MVSVGRHWAQYLVDHKLVKAGDFVWMPVEVPGATYGVQEEKGVSSVFKPLGITWEITDTTLDQAEIINRMGDYLTRNRTKIKVRTPSSASATWSRAASSACSTRSA